MLDTQADTPAAPLPPPRIFSHSPSLAVAAAKVDVLACNRGVNGEGSTLVCEPIVNVHALVPGCGIRLHLPDLTPKQARQLAGYLIDAAAFAEGGDAPDSGALRRAVAVLRAASERAANAGLVGIADSCAESRDALDKLAAVMAPGTEGFVKGSL